jgi:hypothetical protein
MAKKTSIAVFHLILILLLIGCCKTNLDNFYIKISEIRITNNNLLTKLGRGEIINQSEYRIRCFLNENLIEDAKDLNKKIRTVNYCDQYVLKFSNIITDFNISCSQPIWNTTTDTPLDKNNIRFYENKFAEDSQNIRFTIDEWIDLVNHEKDLFDFEWFIEFNEPIISTEYLKFKLLFELADGSEYSTETEFVKFE